MSDLIQRLRAIAVKGGELEVVTLSMDAADHIEALERERDEALEANAGLDKRMRTLDEKLFYAERENAELRALLKEARNYVPGSREESRKLKDSIDAFLKGQECCKKETYHE